MLREQGYPCVFYTDLYGAQYKDHGNDGVEYEITLKRLDNMEVLLHARKYLSYGLQTDYFDHPNCIGWTRQGLDEFEGSGLAVVISNGDEGGKQMEMGVRHAGKVFVDLLNQFEEEIIIDENGWATFKVKARSVSVWAEIKNLIPSE